MAAPTSIGFISVDDTNGGTYVSGQFDQVPLPSLKTVTRRSCRHARCSDASMGWTVTVARSTDLNVQWTGGGVGDVQVTLSDGNTAIGTMLIYSSFPATDGAGTVPSAALVASPTFQ